MQIVINLDKWLYKYAKRHTLTHGEIDEICNAIASGTPLPKEHGRLIDADELKLGIINEHFESFADYESVIDYINSAPTIIESESEVE